MAIYMNTKYYLSMLRKVYIIDKIVKRSFSARLIDKNYPALAVLDQNTNESRMGR